MENTFPVFQIIGEFSVVTAAIRPGIYAVSLFFVVFEFPVIYGTIRAGIYPVSLFGAVYKRTDVYVSVGKSKRSFAVELVPRTTDFRSKSPDRYRRWNR